MHLRIQFPGCISVRTLASNGPLQDYVLFVFPVPMNALKNMQALAAAQRRNRSVFVVRAAGVEKTIVIGLAADSGTIVTLGN